MIDVPAAALATVPVDLPAPPDLADHAIAGRATVPAVWLVELLVRTAAEHEGAAAPRALGMTEVAFPRFLLVEDVPRCAFTVRLEATKGGLRATLASSIALPNGMKRTREHAQLTFSASVPRPPQPPSLTPDYELSAERLYRELIPFGPRYRNLRGSVRLGHDGGTGVVRSPEPPPAQPPLAGCPYLLDAAMHLACVWGQRHAGYVAYPTGFAARALVKPTPWGERRCTVVPRRVEPRRLLCDLWLADEDGEVCDSIVGLAMSPLSSGAPPPAWITLAEERP